MGRPFRLYLDGKVYACGNCRTHLSSSSELVSKHFHSKSGRAYLFHSACNVVGGAQEHRMMTTGKHIVCDIFCAECMSCVGWQYIFAFEESQKYKEGMYILERAMVVDFDKTSPAASLARASSSVSSGSSGYQQAMSYTGAPEHLGALTLFAADDSGSEDED